MLGSGILKGLAVTARNFTGSFHDPARLTTSEYPEQKLALPEAYRSFPFLVCETDADPMGTLRCVACQICEKECPPQCIIIEKSKDKKADAAGKMQIYPAIFAIDTAVCMQCGICAEVCPFDAIKMDTVFEVATSARFETLLLDKKALAKSNAYYEGIRPTEARAVNERLAADRRAAEEKARAAEEKARAAAAAKAAAAKAAPAAPAGQAAAVAPPIPVSASQPAQQPVPPQAAQPAAPLPPPGSAQA